MELSDKDRKDLKKLVENSDCQDNTSSIRQQKHSDSIRRDIKCIEIMKNVHSEIKQNEPERFRDMCIEKCSFLFTYYTNIFNKTIKDEIDLNIMNRFLLVLKMIEDGKVDQHEGSVIVGKLLKDLYVDSAIRRAENIDKENESLKVAPVEGKKISWKEYKILNEK
jgi:hypothetical protein